MNVVIADDDPTTQAVLKGLVQKMNHEVTVVGNGEAAWDIVQQYHKQKMPCLLLVDWEMPILNGLELCKRIKEQRSLTPPYMILITARTDTNDIVKGLEYGADDYICKPFKAAELKARIKVAQRTLELHQELSEVRKALQYQASHDELTGLMNRRAAIEVLEKEISRSYRLGQTLHLAISDVDNFKAVNDNYGHFVGDLVLKDISQNMKTFFRPYDLVSRFGGEEFLLAISDEEANGLDIFERLRAGIADKPIVTEQNLQLNISISIGVISVRPLYPQIEIDQLLVQADQLLYTAKNKGKNRVESGLYQV